MYDGSLVNCGSRASGVSGGRGYETGGKNIYNARTQHFSIFLNTMATKCRCECDAFGDYSTFFLKCFLNITGTRVTQANNSSNNIDVHENASFELVIVFSVLPACIAKNEGGATPAIQNNL